MGRGTTFPSKNPPAKPQALAEQVEHDGGGSGRGGPRLRPESVRAPDSPSGRFRLLVHFFSFVATQAASMSTPSLARQPLSTSSATSSMLSLFLLTSTANLSTS